MQHGRLVEVAERCEVILAHQDVGVSQVGQVLCLGVQFVLNALKMKQERCNRYSAVFCAEHDTTLGIKPASK